MATASDVNIRIKSIIRATNSTNTSFLSFDGSPPALVVTTSTLDGVNLSIPNADYGVLRIGALSTFNFPPNSRSDEQTVILYNDGAASLEVSRMIVSFSLGTKAIVPKISPSPGDSTTAGKLLNLPNPIPFSIAPGSTASFNLSYTALSTGDYVNNLTIFSRSLVSPEYQIDTFQHVADDLLILQSTTTFITNTTILGETSATVVTFTKKLNGTIYTGTNLTLDIISVTGDPGWVTDIYTPKINTISIFWDPDLVNNNSGTYVSTVTVAVSELGTQIGTKTITNISYVNIDYSRYRNLATWISPASSYNSIVGVSLDIINNETVLSIGCGMGGDFSPQYGFGGYNLANAFNLGFRARTIIPKFPYWANVWTFKLNEVEFTYRSGDTAFDTDIPYYRRKAATGYEYEAFFGYEQSLGFQSMFIVTHDGNGSIRIFINNLRELSGDPEFDITLRNLTRAFYYYSASDEVGRYYQLDNAPVGDGTRTQMFRGFDTTFVGLTATSITTVTSIVSLPNNLF